MTNLTSADLRLHIYEESQAMIHRSNWPTDARVVDRRRAEIGRRFAAAIKRATAGR